MGNIGMLKMYLPWFVNVGDEGYIPYYKSLDDNIVHLLLKSCKSPTFSVSRKSYEIIDMILKSSQPDILYKYQEMGVKSIEKYRDILLPKAATYIQSVWRGRYYGKPYRKKLEQILSKSD